MMNPELTLPGLLRKWGESEPDRIFVVRVEGGTLTYGEAFRQGLAWATAFETLGVGAGQQVATLMEKDFDSIHAWMGCAWLRARIAHLNPAYRGRMLESVLATSRAKILLISTSLAGQLETIDLRATGIERIVLLDGEPEADRADGVSWVGRATFDAAMEIRPRELPEGRDVASVTFTSGTTGVSKGVLVHWAQAYLTASEETLDAFGPDEVSYSPMPMFHVSGMGGIYKMAMCGGRVIMRDQFSIGAYFDDIRTYGVTTSVMLESMIATLMVEADKSFEKPPTLQRLIVVPVPPDIDAFKARFGVKIATMYNMTETSGPISSRGFEVDSSLEGSCGYLRPGFEAIIADDNDEALPDGEVGELLLRGREPWTITTEYLGAPEATAAAWRNGWFHTGDSFRRDAEGRYYFVDRRKDAIRRRGENISSIEVENELVAHPDVAEAAAVPVLSDEGGEEVKVFLVLRAGAVFDPTGIIRFLVPRMPHFMIPRYLEVLEKFPKTPSQKTQKHVLRSMGNSAATFDREAHGIRITSKTARSP